MQRTLTIIKPDSMSAGNAGSILAHLESEGFKIVGLKQLRLSHAQAQGFYAVHRERPFYDDLVAFMTEGPVIVAALERQDAVTHLRKMMGATNPEEAAEGTVRALFGTNIERNAIHGSDSPDNALIETAFFFSQSEILANG